MTRSGRPTQRGPWRIARGATGGTGRNLNSRNFARGLANRPTNKPAMPWAAPNPMDPDCRGVIRSRLAAKEVRQETACRLDVSGSLARTRRHSQRARIFPKVRSTAPESSLPTCRLRGNLIRFPGAGQRRLGNRSHIVAIAARPQISLRRQAAKHATEGCADAYPVRFISFAHGSNHEADDVRPCEKFVRAQGEFRRACGS